MAKKMGLSLRVTQAETYFEQRDALAHEWYRFMTLVLPEISWILLPNLGPSIVPYIQQWDIDSIILTGGNDLGEARQRDETEQSILQFATSQNLPVLGVCRGLQVIQNYYGGTIRQHQNQVHVGQNHRIHLLENEVLPKDLQAEYEVNSFHNFGVRKNELALGLEPVAVTPDGEWVEALKHSQNQVLGIQWHPERKENNPELSHKLIRSFFELEKK